MARKTPKTLVGHGIAVLLKNRQITTEEDAPTFTPWVEGLYTLAIGDIETYSGVTGALTATLTACVPGNWAGNTFTATGSLETLVGAPLEPGTRATHITGTHTLTGEVEIPAYAFYLGTPVYTGNDPAWHEILPGETLFTSGSSYPLTAQYVYKAGVVALTPYGEPYPFIDGAISDTMLEAVQEKHGNHLYAKYGHIGLFGNTFTCDTATGEALVEFAETNPNHLVRPLSFGVEALDPRSLPDTCIGGYIVPDVLESLLVDIPTKSIQVSALTILTEQTLEAARKLEKELPALQERLEALHRKLKASPLYSEEAVEEMRHDHK